MIATSTRAGIISRETGYEAFIPANLPPSPALTFDDEMITVLSEADRKLGRLDGITRVLPNPNLFLAMYVKKEAVLSSQIEGTQASLIDVIDVPDSDGDEKTRNDVEEVVNYVNAMNYGLRRLDELPLSLRLIREIHARLLKDVRGAHKNPGEFRKTQNWIGPQGCTLQTAAFVPPPAHLMLNSLSELEAFIYDTAPMPPLIKIALIHAQFETIHPFLDGNGRMGRLLITFWLCHEAILSKPLLYLSYYFKLNRQEYYDRLMNVRLHGQWEEWVKFFLKGIAVASDEAIRSATEIIKLKDRLSALIAATSVSNGQQLLDYLFENPIVTRKNVMDHINVTSPTAGSLLSHFASMGILHDSEPEKQRGKKYYFQEYLDILEKDTDI